MTKICDVCKGALQHRSNMLTLSGNIYNTGRRYLWAQNGSCVGFGHHRIWQSFKMSIEAACFICSARSDSSKSNSTEIYMSQQGVSESENASPEPEFVTTLILVGMRYQHRSCLCIDGDWAENDSQSLWNDPDSVMQLMEDTSEWYSVLEEAKV
jgi:hypothetical protein